MSEQKHTPGPWSFTVYANHLAAAGFPAAVYGFAEDDDTDSPDGGSVSVCDFDDSDSDISKEEALANAALIASAPALLAACRAMNNATFEQKLPNPKDDQWTTEQVHALIDIRAAIASAPPASTAG